MTCPKCGSTKIRPDLEDPKEYVWCFSCGNTSFVGNPNTIPLKVARGICEECNGEVRGPYDICFKCARKLGVVRYPNAER